MKKKPKQAKASVIAARKRVLEIRMTDAEYAEVARAANGIGVSSWVRWIALTEARRTK
jgi:predicted DNA-binding protein (UPF0251 family)